MAKKCDSVSLSLTNVGDNLLNVIEVIRRITNLSVLDAKELCEKTSKRHASYLRWDVSMQEAESAMVELEKVGASAVIADCVTGIIIKATKPKKNVVVDSDKILEELVEDDDSVSDERVGSFDIIDVRDDKVSEANIPEIVGKCFSSLKELQDKVSAAVVKARSSKGFADKAGKIELKWYKIGDKAEAIESLQKALANMALSQVDQADAMNALATYQTAIAKAMNYLLFLGIASMSSNRAIYQTLKFQLEGASKGELSEFARVEIKRTLVQLKNQQDAMAQTERIKEVVKENKSSIADNRAEIEEIKKLDQRQEQELARQRNKDDEHDARLDRLEEDVATLKELVSDLMKSGRVVGCRNKGLVDRIILAIKAFVKILLG